MKDIENNITEGWMIIPPENSHKARRWIKIIEAMQEEDASDQPARNLLPFPDHKAEDKERL